MTPRDFIYWLKGYFELPELRKPVVLTAGQVEIIRRHLAMLPKAIYNPSNVCVPRYGKEFCDWLDRYLSGSEIDLSESQTLRIQQRLDSLFEHAAANYHNSLGQQEG